MNETENIEDAQFMGRRVGDMNRDELIAVIKFMWIWADKLRRDADAEIAALTGRQ